MYSIMKIVVFCQRRGQSRLDLKGVRRLNDAAGGKRVGRIREQRPMRTACDALPLQRSLSGEIFRDGIGAVAH